VMRRRPGIVANSEFAKIPDRRSRVSRGTASGKHGLILRLEP
jgi:hypothetical protein